MRHSYLEKATVANFFRKRKLIFIQKLRKYLLQSFDSRVDIHEAIEQEDLFDVLQGIFYPFFHETLFTFFCSFKKRTLQIYNKLLMILWIYLFIYQKFYIFAEFCRKKNKNLCLFSQNFLGISIRFHKQKILKNKIYILENLKNFCCLRLSLNLKRLHKFTSILFI